MSDNRQRDRGWLEALFASEHRAVLAYARRRLPPDDADDVLAEVFAAAWQHRHKVPDPALPWLYRTAFYHVLHTYRGRGRRERLSHRLVSLPDEVQVDHADTVASAVDDRAKVAAVLAALIPRDAEVLRLASWEQLGTDEFA